METMKPKTHPLDLIVGDVIKLTTGIRSVVSEQPWLVNPDTVAVPLCDGEHAVVYLDRRTPVAVAS